MYNNERIRNIERKVDALETRERILLFLCVLAGIYFIWENLVYLPLNAAKTQVIKEGSSKEGALNVLETEWDKIKNQSTNTISDILDKELETLVSKKHNIEHEMKRFDNNIISATNMVKVLEDILKSNSKIELVKIENTAQEEIENKDSDLGLASSDQKLYKHSFDIEFLSTYAHTYTFLKEMEQLPWVLIWDRIEYNVEEYPKAKVLITIHTISLEEDWLKI